MGKTNTGFGLRAPPLFAFESKAPETLFLRFLSCFFSFCDDGVCLGFPFLPLTPPPLGLGFAFQKGSPFAFLPPLVRESAPAVLSIPESNAVVEEKFAIGRLSRWAPQLWQ